jgi:hypothetical protein
MKNICLLGIVLIVLTVLGGCQIYNKQTNPNEVDDQLFLNLSTDKVTYASGENIEATLELSNEYEQSVLVNKRMILNLQSVIGSLGEVYFKITDKQGKEADFVVRVNVRFPKEEDFIYLKPGELISQTYLLNKWYNIPLTPGEYTVQAIYQNNVDLNGGEEAWKGKITSNIISISIEP